MKQLINIEDEDISPFAKRFIYLWKGKKGYSADASLTLGQTIELAIATTHTFYKDDSDGRFFNNILINDESLIAWDGEELIDIIFFECIKNIKRRLSQARTFNNDID